MKTILLLSSLVIIQCCNNYPRESGSSISQSDSVISFQNDEDEMVPIDEPVIYCYEIKRDYRSDKIKEIGLLSNLELLNGFKWLDFERPFSDYQDCLYNVEIIDDFTIGNIRGLDFLEKQWSTSVIAYKGELIKIALNYQKIEIAKAKSVRDDLTKLLGDPNISNLKLTESKKTETTAYVQTIFDAPVIDETPTSIRGAFLGYKKSRGISRQALDDALSGVTSNDPLYNRPPTTKKGHFNYFVLISFEDIWESTLHLKCTYKRSSQLFIRSKGDYGNTAGIG